MRYQLTLKSMMPEHKAIMGQIRLLLDLAVDLEATLVALDRDGEASQQYLTLALKVGVLSQAIYYLADGVRSHCTREECLLRPSLCELLMKGLAKEHGEIEAQIDKAKLPLAHLKSSLSKNRGVASPDSRWLRAKGYEAKRVIAEACQMIETHMAREDNIQQILEKGLGSE